MSKSKTAKSTSRSIAIISPQATAKKSAGHKQISTDKAAVHLTRWHIRKIPIRTANGALKFGIVVYGWRSDMPGVEDVFWNSSTIVTRVSSTHVQTQSGSSYYLEGPVDQAQCIKRGLSAKTAKNFKDGFPENWKECLVQEFASVIQNDSAEKSFAASAKFTPAAKAVKFDAKKKVLAVERAAIAKKSDTLKEKPAARTAPKAIAFKVEATKVVGSSLSSKRARSVTIDTLVEEEKKTKKAKTLSGAKKVTVTKHVRGPMKQKLKVIAEVELQKTIRVDASTSKRVESLIKKGEESEQKQSTTLLPSFFNAVKGSISRIGELLTGGHRVDAAAPAMRERKVVITVSNDELEDEEDDEIDDKDWDDEVSDEDEDVFERPQKEKYVKRSKGPKRIETAKKIASEKSSIIRTNNKNRNPQRTNWFEPGVFAPLKKALEDNDFKIPTAVRQVQKKYPKTYDILRRSTVRKWMVRGKDGKLKFADATMEKMERGGSWSIAGRKTTFHHFPELRTFLLQKMQANKKNTDWELLGEWTKKWFDGNHAQKLTHGYKEFDAGQRWCSKVLKELAAHV